MGGVGRVSEVSDVIGERQDLEAALAAARADAEALTKAAGTVERELKRARASALVGQMRELRRALSQAESLAAELAAQVARARSAHDIDEGELLASGAYTKETAGRVLVDVLGKAQQAGPRFKPAPFLASLAAAHEPAPSIYST